MSIIPFFPFLLVFLLSSSGQQLGLQEKPEHYLVIEIGPAKAGGKFEFTLVRLARSGKECDLRRLECKAPYRLNVFDETYLILYGKSGEGKVATRYRMFSDEKLSYQSFEKGEAIVIEFLPKLVGGGSTKWWTEGNRSAPRLSVTVMSKEPTVY
jgi:hypothetical protein